VDPSEAKRLLLSSQSADTLTQEQRREIRACLREHVFCKPGKQWSDGDLELAGLWLCEYKNRIASICRAQVRVPQKLKAAMRLSPDVALEGFGDAIAKFMERRQDLKQSHWGYDPGGFPDHEKVVLLTEYFKAGMVYATMSLLRRPRHVKFADIDDVGPIEDQRLPPLDAGIDPRRYLDRMRDLVTRTLSIPGAEQALAWRRAGLRPQDVARRLGLSLSVISDLRHALVWKCKMEGGDDRDLTAAIAEKLGINPKDAKVAFSRAKDWVHARLGQPFPTRD
jgi:hypothetical protein